jgi:exo-1,4-beta-D-glucosaminidase
MGTPHLNPIHFEFRNTTLGVSESLDARFGIREVTSELTSDGYRVYLVNGRRILIRGAGWAPDLFLRMSQDRYRDEMAYVRHAGLNAIRFEGKFEDPFFFDLADEVGMLMLPGWSCCDAWQR